MPDCENSATCCLRRCAEACADGLVQGGVLGELLLGGEFGEPEVEDGVGNHTPGHF